MNEVLLIKADGSEATYEGYARQPIAAGDLRVTFPECRGGLETITHFAIAGDLGCPPTELFGHITVSSGLTPNIDFYGSPLRTGSPEG